jgi:hypothetical protein
MSIDEVKATIRAGEQALDEARTTMERVGAELAEATGLALAVLTGTEHELAGKARSTLAEAQREIELTLRRLAGAREHARRYTAALG